MDDNRERIQYLNFLMPFRDLRFPSTQKTEPITICEREIFCLNSKFNFLLLKFELFLKNIKEKEIFLISEIWLEDENNPSLKDLDQNYQIGLEKKREKKVAKKPFPCRKNNKFFLNEKIQRSQERKIEWRWVFENQPNFDQKFFSANVHFLKIFVVNYLNKNDNQFQNLLDFRESNSRIHWLNFFF